MSKKQIWYLIAFITAFVLYFFFFRKSDEQQAEGELKDRQPRARGPKTISDFEARTYANQLEGAMEGAGTNETRINLVIENLSSSNDVKAIDDAFGIRQKHSLGAWLSSDGYLEDFTRRLEEKGISYSPPIIDKRAWYEF